MSLKRSIQTLCLTVLIGCSMLSSAQDIPSAFQNYFNPQRINPATVGDTMYSNITTVRSFETGFAENRNSYSVSGQDVVSDGKMGIGINVEYTTFWVEKQWKASAQYSYTLYLPQNGSIKFGIEAGLINYTFALTEFEFYPDDTYDPAFDNDIENLFLPVGMGVLLEFGKFKFGMSSPEMLTINVSTSHKDKVRDKTQFYLYSEYDISVNESLSVLPSISVYQRNSSGNLNWEASALLDWRDKLWLGSAYNSRDAISVFANWKTKFGVGVGYNVSFFQDNAVTSNHMQHLFSLNYWFR